MKDNFHHYTNIPMAIAAVKERIAKEAKLKRSGVRRTPGKFVDEVETEGTDATLNLRKSGVGTVTFDTSTGETMISSLVVNRHFPKNC